MGIKVTVNSVEKNRIALNAEKRATIRTVAVQPVQKTNFLSSLNDVDMSEASQNDTLVYDENNRKFIVKELPILNGGTF